MTIDFHNLLDDIDWDSMSVDQQSSPSYFWHEGGLLGDAPVDFKSTFDGAMWVTSKIDPAFNINGLRVRPNFLVPRHHHNMRQLIIVFGGEYTIEWNDGSDQRRKVGPGEFFISEPGTPYTMIAGPDGVTYTETWPEPRSRLETTWYDRGWVRR